MLYNECLNNQNFNKSYIVLCVCYYETMSVKFKFKWKEIYFDEETNMSTQKGIMGEEVVELIIQIIKESKTTF